MKQSECFTQLADFSNYNFVMVETRSKNGHSTNNSPETSPSRQHLSELAMGANQNITRGLSVFEEMRSMMEQRGELADVKGENRWILGEQTDLHQ